MAGLVDYDALVLDLRGALGERASWGRGQVLGLIDELEQRHRIVETEDAAVLRRLGDHIVDTTLGLLPRSATPDPLGGDDRMTESIRHETSVTMEDGAASDHPHHGGDACPPKHHQQPPSSPPADSPQVGRPRPPSPAPALP